ncbi:MAG: hypothetical protein HRT77_16410 [Halioglobus sp.]|nr:hypothetical protein [Halioglobus sp.]
MNKSFKPLALAAAVAGLTSGAANAQTAGSYASLGDAAFVPYYSVEDAWVTGVHIINTSNLTQVIKLRLRRAEDSRDIMDFNLILSPDDVWTGTISGDADEMRFITDDNSCTAPELLNNGDGRTYAPIVTLEGAQEGYLEVIGMAAADAAQSISVGALHGANGLPANCNSVRENFFVAAVTSNATTTNIATGVTSTYTETDNVLKVSYFLRDSATGIEFGNDSIMFEDFASIPMMTHQEFGLEAYSIDPANALNGWDFPDVRGGGNNAAPRDSIDVVRDSLAATAVVNDWSYNPATGAATDWVVTFPGQYALVDFYSELAGDPQTAWDYREIPATATFVVFDREEGSAVPGGLNFSPSPAPDSAFLPFEVNVVRWGDNDVLESRFATDVNPADAGITSPFGWARLSVEGRTGLLGNAWCDVAAGPDPAGDCTMTSVSGPVPMVGFAAWERTFSEDLDRNYGRIVEHSFTTS